MSGMDSRRLYKPKTGLPWKAITKGTDKYVWWEVVDKDGWEVCVFGGVIPDSDDYHESFRQMAFILCSVNGTDEIVVDINEIRVEWL